MISFMFAMDDNRLIGKDNTLPWYLPADLQYFKKVTMGHPILMGRKTYESIGKPLPGRENIILTRNTDYQQEGITVISDMKEAVAYADALDAEVFVIGGAEIFQQLLSDCKRLYITQIHHSFEGDTYFPELNMSKWQTVSRMTGIEDEKNRYPHEFIVLERIEN
ncbi:dihydrofolate reductase [Peribacillus loiseleuriae]|uniref:Dihydrofolate reductase n=1 Tax=Peribacillus loiseleuriae TaxID=1679170 RepID=A0A0K9GW78_9BACI|nr:dihydrofolate reductase [Peribacillus loiseleuriae]KMY50492.1 dihydrofolate reductase [Peribacillus loiseleuriae]